MYRNMNIEYAFLILLCYFPLQQLGSALNGGSEDVRASYSHSRKRRNLVFQDGAIIQVKLLSRNVKDFYLFTIIEYTRMKTLVTQNVL